MLPLETADSVAEYHVNPIALGADLDCRELTSTPSSATYDFSLSPDTTFANFSTTHHLLDGSTRRCVSSVTLTQNTTCGYSMAIYGDPRGKRAGEFALGMQGNDEIIDNNDFCKMQMVRGWIRSDITLENRPQDTNNIATNSSQFLNATSADIRTFFISCSARMKSAPFNVTMSSSGAVLSATQLQAPNYDQSFAAFQPIISRTIGLFSGAIPILYHNDTFAMDWMNYLIKELTDSTDLLDATKPLPTYNTTAPFVSEVFSRIFAIQMSLQAPSILAPAASDASVARVPAQILSTESRVFISPVFFAISLGILCIDLAVAVTFYLHRPSPFLPRLPNSIASQIAYFAGSHIMDDVKNAGGDLQELDKQGYRYAYGTYLGKDGWAHVGIGWAPYVTSLDADKSGSVRWWKNRLRKRNGQPHGQIVQPPKHAGHVDRVLRDPPLPPL